MASQTTAAQKRRLRWTLLIVLVTSAALLTVSFRAASSHLLMRAALNNRAAAAKLLVALGAPVDAQMHDDSRRSVLHLAAANGNVGLIHFLIQHGAAVDTRATFGVTPRAEAEMAGHTDAAHVLASYGAQPVPPDLHVP